jgi:sialic acid synthase SpsE/protoporphyrinogen oxidase
LKRKAYILGAGPSGLVTAWKLLENDWDVTIIEKNNISGGLCRSWEWKNFIIDTGPHIFHTPDTFLKNFWLKNFGSLLIEGKFWCKNVKGKNFDEFYDYPLSVESLNKYKKELKKTIKGELKKINPEQRNKAKSYKEYIDSFIGPTLREMFFEKYPKKIWGIGTDKMTPDWAPNRIKFRKKILPFYTEEFCAVGKYGTGSIYESIEKKIRKLNGKIKFNETVIGLKKNQNKIEEIITTKKKYKLEKDNIVISTLPLNLTSRFLGKNSDLKFRGICSVYLFYNQKFILPKKVHWLYFDSEQVIFNRVTENKKLSKFTCPFDKTYLTAEITYSPGDKFSKVDKNKIMKTVADQMQETNIVNNKNLIHTEINYEPYVYPIQFANYKKEVANIKSYVESFENLFSIGAGGEFNYADSQILFHKSFDLVNSLVTKFNAFTNESKNPRSIKFNKEVKIGKTKISEKHKTYIIAEAGLNHNGSFQLAKQLIDKAKAAGCDSIKFQSFLPDSRVSKNVKSEKYAEKVIGTEESLSELFERLSLNFKVQKKIFAYARKRKLEIFSTPFDFQSADFLEKMNVSAYKIASADLVNLPLIKHVASKQKTIILSTGMSKISEIDEAVETVRSTGNKNLILLHCNSSYPSSYSEMNLKFIDTLKKMYDIPIGLSDHTTDLLATKVAIARGCNIVERHFTIDKDLEGPDHILSSDFQEMKELIGFKKIYKKWNALWKTTAKSPELKKNIVSLLGDGIKKIQPNEYITLNSQKKSLYAKKLINKGEKFTKNNVCIKGPTGGIVPKFFDIILNKSSKCRLDKDQPITWNDI